MNSKLFLVLGLICSSALAQESLVSAQQEGKIRVDKPRVIERGEHHRKWEQVSVQASLQGKEIRRTNTWVELQTGMHQRQNGQWVDASEEIVMTSQGAAATNTAFKVHFKSNINGIDAIDLTTPDGKRLKSRVYGLSYYDASTGTGVLLAELQDSVGQIVGKNRVTYTNAFDDVKADCEYVVTKSGFEQNIVLREKLPDPAFFGLDPKTTKLQALTEFFHAPQPARPVARKGKEKLANQTLGFGTMKMVRGKAFFSEKGARKGEVQVDKEWQQLDGRDFLIEEVPFKGITNQLSSLPAPAKTVARKEKRMGKGSSILSVVAGIVKQPRSGGSASPLQLAMVSEDDRPGFVLDYPLVGSYTDYTLLGDTTYHITGPTYLFGDTVIEGGAVIKSSVSQGDGLVFGDDQGSIICKTAPYRPAVFTSRNDNKVGAIISGSTGNPSSADVAVAFYTVMEWPTLNLHDLRVLYAGTGFQFHGAYAEPGTGYYRLIDIQVLNCGTGMTLGGNVYLGNVLFATLGTVINNTYPDSEITLEHITASNTGELCLGETWSNFTLTTRNCIFNCVTGYACQSGVFTQVGAGGYYLPANSSYRNAGVTGIDNELKKLLKQKTTSAPSIVTTPVTSLTRRSIRDDDGSLDMGYHYDPIDYALQSVQLVDLLVVGPGTVISTYALSAGVSYGIEGSVELQGTAKSPCAVVGYQTVQEGSSTTWQKPYVTVGGGVTSINTLWSVLANSESLIDAPASISLNLRHSQFFNKFIVSADAAGNVFNCLFHRTGVMLWSEATLSGSSEIQSCTFIGGTLELFQDNFPVIVRNNIFDQTEPTGSYVAHDHNAYILGEMRLEPAAIGDRVVADFGFVSGSLGNWYLPGDSLLRDAGSTLAPALGLYHYTTQQDNSKEASTQADIGFHYPALDQTGALYDTDGDGLSDIEEDLNGNGLYETGETPWNGVSLPSGAIAWWKGDNNANDSIGTAHGTVSGATCTAGLVNQAFSFDGVDDSVEIPDSAALNPTTAITIEGWVNPSQTEWAQDLVSKDGEYSDRQFLITLNNYNQVRAHVWTPGGLLTVASSSSVELNTWAHFAMTYDGSSLNVYVNGVLAGTIAGSGNILTTTQPVRIGGGAPPGAPPYQFGGQIDEVTLYGRALIASEIQKIYQAGAGGKSKPSIAVRASVATAQEASLLSGVFTVSRGGYDVSSPLSISFSLSGTADEALDFLSISRTVTIQAGASEANVIISPCRDSLDEDDETVTLTLAASQDYSLGAQSATVTILDKPVVTITATDAGASESGPDTGTFTISRSGGDQSTPLFVAFQRSGDAINGTDYLAIGPNVTIPAGATSVQVTVTPILDANSEGNETVVLTLVGTGNYDVGNPGTATITIRDSSVVTISATDPTASEGSPDVGTFTVTRIGGDQAIPLNVSFLTPLGTAGNGTDYETLLGSVTIPAGSASALVTVIPKVDTVANEVDETVILRVANSTAYSVGEPSSATVTIREGLSGVLINLEKTSGRYLRIKPTAQTSPLPFINVANSARGTVARIYAGSNLSTDPSKVVGEYYSAPNDLGRDPSRTTVDRYGNVWVGNRDEGSTAPNGHVDAFGGSITQIGVVIGGTRCDKYGNAAQDGNFLKPPFVYNTCVDRHGDTVNDPPDGLIKTSLGLGTILPWSNASNADSSGGVSTAEDEAIIKYVRVAPTAVRTIAVDGNNNVWVGSAADSRHQWVDGALGMPVTGWNLNFRAGGYGGVIGGDGAVWSSGYLEGDSSLARLVHFIPGIAMPVTSGGLIRGTGNNYGITVDPISGDVWQALYAKDRVRNTDNVMRFGFSHCVQTVPIGQAENRGIVIDGSGNIWVGGSSDTVFHLKTSGELVGSIPMDITPQGQFTVFGLNPIGVAVDSSGMVWAICQNGVAMRIDPQQNPDSDLNHNPPIGRVVEAVPLGGGSRPYNYSDMSGFIALSTTQPSGVWDYVEDAGENADNSFWSSLMMEASIPADTKIIIEVRAANSIPGLTSWPFIAIEAAGGTLPQKILLPSGIKGRFLEVRANLTKKFGVPQTPELRSLSVQKGTIGCGLDITKHPKSLAVPAGDPALFSVAAQVPSGITASYQWFKDGVSIPNANASTLNLSSVQYTDAGRYSVRVTGGGCTLESAPGRLHVKGNPPTLVTDLNGNVSTSEGQVVTLTAQSSAGVNLGERPISYQWRRNNEPISEPGASGVCASGDCLVSMNVTGDCANAGTYSVVFWNKYGQIATTNCEVSISGKSKVMVMPSAVTVTSSTEDVTLTAIPCMGPDSELACIQWYHTGDDGQTTAIPNANSLIYTIKAPITCDKLGTYTVSLSDRQWSGPYEASALVSGGNTAINVSIRTTLHMTPTGSGAWSYQWARSVDAVTYTPISGATAASYALPLDDPSGTRYRATAIQQGQVATLEVAHFPYGISILGTENALLDLTYAAEGSGLTWSYQWYFKPDSTGQKNIIPGAIDSQYTVDAIDSGEFGEYSVQVNCNGPWATTIAN